MKYNISKELFEIIINKKIIEYNGVFGKYISAKYDNTVDLSTGIKVVARDGGVISESINDFYFKCKEWAYNHGIILSSETCDIGICCISTIEDQGYLANQYEIESTSEQQAVFDACQWIIDNRNNLNL